MSANLKNFVHFIFLFFCVCSIPIPKNLRKVSDIRSDDIVILHTNDVHCGVQDKIGYDGLMLYKKQLLVKYKNVLVVDAGDHIQGGTIGQITNGDAIIDIMNKIGYDVVTIGNHEFDYGLDVLDDCAKKLSCGYISCNYCLNSDKKAIYDPYVIKEVGGKKIGFIGVATPQTLSKTYLITEKEGENLKYNFLTDRKSQELHERVQRHINEAKDEGADYIIILAHLGIEGDAEEENTSAGLLKAVTGAHALIDGHSHKVYSKTTPDKNNKNVILAQTGTKLENIGVLIIHTDGTLTHENINKVPYDEDLADETLAIVRSKETYYVDKEMNEYINSIYDSFSDELNKVIGKTDFPLTVYKNATASKQSHEQMSRTSENILCNLVTDAMRHFGDADVTIMNAGSVRDDIYEGDITYQEVINTMPFSNDVIVKKITGQDILNALEFGVRSLPDTTSRFPQVSGITYKIDISIDSTVVVDKDEVFLSVEGERRVYDVKVNGEDLDLNKEYTIASNSFILAGGDGYSMFTDAEIVKTAVGVDNEVLLKYINETLKGVVPDKYSKTEGRILKTNGKELSDDIVIIHTNDVHCGVQDKIGYDGLMLFKKQLLTKYKNVLVVDAGDHIQGGTMGQITNGAAIIDIMNKIGYDVVTLGNHEFDYGVNVLDDCAKKLSCGYISCNYCYHKNKTTIYDPYKIIEIGGKKIGFIGVATPQTFSKTFLITLKEEDDEYIYDFLTDNHSQELYDKVQEHINYLKSTEEVDYIILVAHLGIEGDAEEENTSAGLLKAVTGVDALIDGHSHKVYSKTTPDKNNKNVILAQTGTKLEYIGVLTIHTNGTLTHENINSIPYESIIDGDSFQIERGKEKIWVDKNMFEYINSKFNSFSDKLYEVIGKTNFPLNVYKNATQSKESHTQMSRTAENNLCNLVTDAMRYYGGADVTIMNAGSVRDDINEGDITYQEVINTMPFSNDVIVKEITGQDILDALEHGVRHLPGTTSRFPQVSGITYKIDVSINSSVVVDDKEVFVEVGGARRVYDVKINDQDLVIEKVYSIASSSFILGGGDGYSMFSDKEITKTSAGVDNEVLLKYIRDNLKGEIPKEYMEPEGRIIKTMGKTKLKDIKIIHTNDVHCGVQDAIGYDGLSLFKKQLEMRYKNVLLVDAGDHIQGGTMGQITSGLAIIDIMNKLDYDVATLGNHEFDYGIEQLETCKDELLCGYISCNYCKREDKKAIYDPYKIIEIGGKKIGFIGVATPQTLSKTYLITKTDANGESVYDFLTENHSQELFDRVQSHIDDLKDTQGVDYIIILAHLGIGGDALEENTSAGLIKNIKRVNALIDGHTHLVYYQNTPDKDGKLIPIAQTGTKLNHIGVFTIHENGTFTHEDITEVPYDNYLDSESYQVTRSKKERWVDINMYRYINAKFDSFSDKLNEVIGRTEFILNVYAIGTTDKQSHLQLSRTSENILCNLVTDAMRHFGEADVTIMNAGSVRDDLYEGDITYQNIINIMPFSNDVIVKRITGQDILDALEFGARTLPATTSRFPQVSGITYKIDISIDSTVVVDKDEVFLSVEGERRVYDVKVNGEDLDLNKEYTIASNSFILAGGDGYSMFTDAEIVKTAVGVDNEVLLKYIQETLHGVVPEKYRQVEGRIIKTKRAELKDDIAIIHTNDVHCGVQDSIGYDGLMLYKKLLLTQYKNVILVDAGDHIQGGILGSLSNGLAIIDIMNKLEYDVVTLGNHEFDYGIDKLKACAKRLNPGYISVNYCFHKNKTAIYPAYKIIEKGGKKIAFIGVTTPDTSSKTYLEELIDEDDEIIYDFLNENHKKDLYERVQENIDKVRSEGADYVIIVAHLGIGDSIEEENTSSYLLKNLRNVDALIDGHTHQVYSSTTPDKSGNKIPFAQSGTKLNNIGVFILHTDGKITHENISAVPYDEILVQDALKTTRGGNDAYVDKEMNQFINDKFISFSSVLDQTIGHTDFILNIYEPGTTVKEPSKQLSRISENILCNLVTDAMRHFGEADVSIMNAGTVRDDINTGDIKYQNIIDIMPYSNDILVKEITGQAILDALEYGVRFLPDPSARFPQVSGISFLVDTSINSGVIVDKNEAFVRVGGKRRVYNVTVNGEKLDLLKKYTIASNSYILSGIDGYTMLAEADVIKTAIGTDNEILMKYISETLNGVVPEKYKEVEGRIIIGNSRDSSVTDDGSVIKYSYISIIYLLFLLF